MQYSNPRMRAVITDWPYGEHRTTATFEIEQSKRGERGVRTTIDPKTGRATVPKKLTYARKARIVDGEDEHTYILELTSYGFITVMRGDMKVQAEDAIFPDNERHPALLALFSDK